MKTIEVDVDLDRWTTDELLEELRERGEDRGGDVSLKRVYEHYYTNPKLEAPQVLKDHIYAVLGKSLA